MKTPKIEVQDETPLKWPDGWPRTLIDDRQSRSQWKKSAIDYRKMVAEELQRLGATAARITSNATERARLDPGVAVWFSTGKVEDFTWQKVLQLDDPAPTLDQIDAAFRRLVANHHPDRIAAGSGGDLSMFQKLREQRDKAKAWVLGTNTQSYEHCIPCDTFTEVRYNLAGIRLALSYFRGLERIGIPAILERVMNQAFRAQLTDQKGAAHAAST